MATKKSSKKVSTARATKAKTAPRKVGLGVTTFLINMVPRSLSGETAQDSEPHLTVKSRIPRQIVATARTPNPGGGAFGPIYVSLDDGNTWKLNPIVPSVTGSLTGTQGITTSFGSDGKMLYAAILSEQNGNFEVLRTDKFSAPEPMTVVATRTKCDQPFIHATRVTSGSAKDRVYIGINDRNFTPALVTIDETADGKAAVPFFGPSPLDQNRATSQPMGPLGPQTRPFSHSDGTVYAAFYGWRRAKGNLIPTGPKDDTLMVIAADVVVVRDDDQGGIFTDLKDGDGQPGKRVVQKVVFPFRTFGTSATGQQRIRGSISIAVDPRKSSTVWVAWGDQQPGSFLTLHVRKSTDSGNTWSKDLTAISNATNAALAITEAGIVGLLYQQLVIHTVGGKRVNKWESRLRFTRTEGLSWFQLVFSTAPADTPKMTVDPYLGDYDHMVAVGNTFYGVFSANNEPDLSHFPRGVKYQRNVNFKDKTLRDVDGETLVPVSIDPFFFKVTFPCQTLSDKVDALAQRIQDMQATIDEGLILKSQIAKVEALMKKLRAQLANLTAQLNQCLQQNP